MDYDGQKFHYHPEQEKCNKKNTSEKMMKEAVRGREQC